MFPFLRVRIVSPRFADLADEAREELLGTAIDLDLATLRSMAARLFVRFELLAAEGEDPSPLASQGETWLGTFADGPRVVDPRPGATRAAHFYGFKGGQGRTTLLAFAANELARDGLRVLVVDLDAEAPSLDLVYGLGTVAPEATLVGLRAGLSPSPVTVSAPPGGGSVSLLAYRPSAPEFDLDATALAFEAAVHAPSQERLAAVLRDGLAREFDLVLFDHRTGLGPTVPAWVRTVPGPVIVFDRLDGQSRRATRDVARIWMGLESPGLLVSYVPAALSVEQFRDQLRGEAWPWLDALALAMSQRAESELGPDDVEDHWIPWPDDNAFRRRVLPQRDEVGGSTRESVSRLREILGLTGRRVVEGPPLTLHPSGATDQGLFIATDALRELCQPASPIRFVLGRKGTGKTRLLSELVRRSVGEPLVVAEDETLGGLRSNDLDLQAFVRRAQAAGDTDGLWWSLIDAALRAGTTEADRFREALATRTDLAQGIDVRNAARNTSGGPRVFLVDGLETMSSRDQARELIQALLRVTSTVEQDPILRSRISLRVFLRTDIARWGFENFEQQSHGKRIELSWSTQSILNFVLSRLPHLPWIAANFAHVVRDVRSNESDIQQGLLTEQDCFSRLLEIFPAKLGRLNLNTTTFLRTYFSDDPSGEQSYYPRVYHAFLESIDRAGAPLIANRINQDVILRAHDEASESFLTQVRQELRFLAPLDERSLERLLNALKGGGTPFIERTLKRDIRNSLKLPKADIDATLDAMKEIGIFEQHPKLVDHWRVGRLFKSALKMKYRRGGD